MQCTPTSEQPQAGHGEKRSHIDENGSDSERSKAYFDQNESYFDQSKTCFDQSRSYFDQQYRFSHQSKTYVDQNKVVLIKITLTFINIGATLIKKIDILVKTALTLASHFRGKLLIKWRILVFHRFPEPIPQTDQLTRPGFESNVAGNRSLNHHFR
jgi:hypothetical protein